MYRLLLVSASLHRQFACDLQAEEIMLALDLTRYDGIVIVSGDGLMYEVINGLMKRPDG